MAALVFLSAIVTQWVGMQLNIVADARFGGDADALTRFFGTFNFILGSCSFVVQLFATSRALRRFGLAVTILDAAAVARVRQPAHPARSPAFWSVLLTNAFDQGLRFSVDRPTYELLYLPIAPGAARPHQERDRHRRQPDRRRGRRGDVRRRDARLLHAARIRARARAARP